MQSKDGEPLLLPYEVLHIQLLPRVMYVVIFSVAHVTVNQVRDVFKNKMERFILTGGPRMDRRVVTDLSVFREDQKDKPVPRDLKRVLKNVYK